jgi:hypothetical protein
VVGAMIKLGDALNLRSWPSASRRTAQTAVQTDCSELQAI